MESIFELLMEAAMEIAAVVAIAVVIGGHLLLFASKRINKGTKTLVYLISSGLLCSFIGWMSWQSYRTNNMFGAVVGGIVTVEIAVVFLFSAVYGHKGEWKQE